MIKWSLWQDTKITKQNCNENQTAKRLLLLIDNTFTKVVFDNLYITANISISERFISYLPAWISTSSVY